MKETSYPQYVFSCGCITETARKTYLTNYRMTCPKPEHLGATLEERIIKCQCGTIFRVLPKDNRSLCDNCREGKLPVELVPKRGNRNGGSVWHDPGLEVKRLERNPCLDCPNVVKSKIVEPCRSCAYPGIWDDQIRFGA